MFCSACGSQISLAAEVCPSCGKPTATSPGRALTRVGVRIANDPSASDSWARPTEAVQPAMAPAPPSMPLAAGIPRSASIFAGDLDIPSFPRDLPGRVALLTGLVMAADLLLPWVTLNGEGIAPTHFGLLALLVVAALLAVIAPPLIPRWRRHILTRMAPFGVGALLLGCSGALWGISGPLWPTVAAAFIARINASGQYQIITPTGALLSATTLQVTPALGLYLFMLGACALIVAGYRMLADEAARP